MDKEQSLLEDQFIDGVPPLRYSSFSIVLSSIVKVPSHFYIILFIIFFNFISHFLPPERSALAPDEYGNLNENRSAHGFLTSHRPADYLFLALQEKYINLDTSRGFICIILASSLLLFVVYLLMTQIFNRLLAALVTIFYILLPNKLDLYHTLVYVSINIAYALYILSFYFFIVFTKKDKLFYFLLSIFSYSIAIFWYEAGFFLPLILGVYVFLYNKQKVKFLIYFLIPAALYLLFRITIMEGGHSSVTFSRALYNFFIMFPNHYLGRYIIRAIVYALYRFPTIEMPWIGIIALINIVLFYFSVSFVSKKVEFPSVDKKQIILAITIMFVLILPNSLYIIESRHTGLASVGFVMLLPFCLSRIRFHVKKVLIASCFGMLIVCQGTAWNQVVACRIVASVFKHIKNHKDEILSSHAVIIDQYDFSKNIPYTWGERQMNMLDNYWGMQAFAPWGLYFMVKISTHYDKPIYIVRSKIEEGNGQFKFDNQSVLKEGTFMINYHAVYKGTFKNGEDILTYQ